MSAGHSETEPWKEECQETRRNEEKGQGQVTVLPKVGPCARLWQRGGYSADSERSKMLDRGSTGKKQVAGASVCVGGRGWDSLCK